MIEWLNEAQHLQPQEIRHADPLVDEAIRELERILTSDTFVRTQRKAKDFLAFVVLERLLGDADRIKEMTIAIRAFHESADFNPMESSKVRVAALALRQRLAAYYAGEGFRDPIEITLPIGTYVPRIRYREQPRSSRRRSKRSHQRPARHSILFPPRP
jgi:hypothetical protein